jgi:hypothetical protein
MSTDPYFFPFEIVNKANLIPGENYYMKLNDNIIKRHLDRRLNVPVSDLKGTFVRLETEKGIQPVEYAVFKDVYIMNKLYKPGLCRMMLVRYPEGFIAMDGCDSYSDEFKSRIINTDREVYLGVNYWRFGIPTEEKLVTQRAIQKIDTRLPESLMREVSQFKGTEKPIGGKKSKKNRKNRKNQKNQKNKFKSSKHSRKNRTKKR